VADPQPNPIKASDAIATPSRLPVLPMDGTISFYVQRTALDLRERTDRRTTNKRPLDEILGAKCDIMGRWRPAALGGSGSHRESQMSMVGRTLGGYTVVERIGAGGMGEVYLATHRRIDRHAAIKLLLPALSKDADIVARFFNEARATSRIKHPGIVEIYDCDVLEDRAYIVMEYLEGENLASALERQGTLHVVAAISIVAQIASALSAAHAQGIVHRDLKPENVFLALDSSRPGPPVVKILDFGIAKLMGEKAGALSHTRTGSLLGTPVYMSPEQCRGISAIDHRADIYALGCILFELLTGRPPFVKEAPGDLLVAHIAEPPPVPSSLNPGIPRSVDQLILSMLAKDPAARPQSMDSIVATLAALPEMRSRPGATLMLDAEPHRPNASPIPVAGGTQLLSKQSTFSRTASEVIRLEQPKRRGRLVLIALGVAGAIGVIAVVGNLRPSRPPRVAVEVPVPVVPSRVMAPAAAPAPKVEDADLPSKIGIAIATSPPGASLWVAGGSRGQTPLRLVLPRGTVLIDVTLKREGYVDKILSLRPDRDQSLEVPLDALEKPHPHPSGHHHKDKPTPVAPTKPEAKPSVEKKYQLMGD
jgi:eukaryotic-like serine/threonine-protein kinase